ncbi:MAG: Rieske (2Fe-2S) protein [Nocardioides sp.]
MTAETETPPLSAAEPRRDLTRRGVIRSAAVGGLALPVLAACGGDDEPAAEPADSAGEDTGGEESGGEESVALAATGDVPSGGGMVLPDDQVVITQPSDGEFKAFTAVCTHQKCVVASVSDGTINCDCHGSKYSIEDGSVANGPATEGLEEIAITVDGDQITLA